MSHYQLTVDFYDTAKDILVMTYDILFNIYQVQQLGRATCIVTNLTRKYTYMYSNTDKMLTFSFQGDVYTTPGISFKDKLKCYSS